VTSVPGIVTVTTAVLIERNSEGGLGDTIWIIRFVDAQLVVMTKTGYSFLGDV